MDLTEREMGRLCDLIRGISIDDWQLLRVNRYGYPTEGVVCETTSNGIRIVLSCEAYLAISIFLGEHRCYRVVGLWLDNVMVAGSYDDFRRLGSLSSLAKSLVHKFLTPIWSKEKNESDEKKGIETEEKKQLMSKLGIKE